MGNCEMVKVQSDEQQGTKSLVTVATAGAASRSGSFLLSWTHFQVDDFGPFAIKKLSL